MPSSSILLWQCAVVLVSVSQAWSLIYNQFSVLQKLYGASNLEAKNKESGWACLFPIFLPLIEMGQVAEHSKQRGKQLFLEIESLEIAFYLSGKKKKCIFLHRAEREILHILIRSVEKLGEKRTCLAVKLLSEDKFSEFRNLERALNLHG